MNSTMESASDNSGLRVSSFDRVNQVDADNTTIKGSPEGKENQPIIDEASYRKSTNNRMTSDLMEEDVHLEERPNISQTPTELRLHSALGGSILEDNDKSPSPAPGANSRSNLSYASLRSQPVDYEEAHSNMSHLPYQAGQEQLKDSVQRSETPVRSTLSETASIPKNGGTRFDRMQSSTDTSVPSKYDAVVSERQPGARESSTTYKTSQPVSKKESASPKVDQHRYVSIRTQPSAVLESPIDQHDSIRTSLPTETAPETPVEFQFPPKLGKSHPGDIRDPSLAAGGFDRPTSASSTREDYDARLAVLEAEIEYLKLQKERSSSYLISTPMRAPTMESDLDSVDDSVDESTAYSDYADETAKELEADHERPLQYHKSVYDALHMGEIDALSLTEAHNRLKVITEAFKDIPFPKLMKIIPRIGKYMSEDDVCFNFANEIHEVIYEGRPLRRNRNGDINRQCLTEMVEATQTMKICQDSVNEVLLNYMKK